jgi:hypothetical protein
MATPETTLQLQPSFFTAREQPLVVHGPLSASAFLFESGVAGLRLANDLGQLVMLPFQGQQIWSTEFRGRNLTMHSMFREPRPTRQFLETFGGFLQHCGATAMGGPSKEDTHPLHGELPNAPYQKAHLAIGQDEKGKYIGLSGQYQHTVAFSYNYLAEPMVRLYAGSTLIRVSMTITNLKQSAMELMYLAHVNFLPVDNGRLVYSARSTPEHVRVRTSIPAHIRPQPGYVEFIEALKNHPEKHHLLAPGLMFDPEIVFFIDYLADEAGWAHTLQIHPDGRADYLRHRPSELKKGTRWICRTADQDALAMVEPGTAEPEGYLAEKAKGNLEELPGGGVFHCEIEMGALSATETRQIEAKIADLVGSSSGHDS